MKELKWSSKIMQSGLRSTRSWHRCMPKHSFRWSLFLLGRFQGMKTSQIICILKSIQKLAIYVNQLTDLKFHVNQHRKLKLSFTSLFLPMGCIPRPVLLALCSLGHILKPEPQLPLQLALMSLLLTFLVSVQNVCSPFLLIDAWSASIM